MVARRRIGCDNYLMGEDEHSVSRTSASADFLEWNFRIMTGDSPWAIEQGMTQLLAHQNAEGFGPSLADAVQDDARVINELGRRQTPTAVAALRAFAAMSTVDTQRDLARMHADRLVSQGLPEPRWTRTIGRVQVDGCWWAHDPFDETAIVVCAFSYAGADEHAILAVIDRTLGGGLFRELLLGTNLTPWLDMLRRADEIDDGLVSEPLDRAHARRLLEDAIATSDELLENRRYRLKPVPAAYRKMRALTLARARGLSDVAVPPEPLPDSVEIELLKRTFLASGAASELPTDAATRQAVDLLIEQFTEEAACHPLRLGPRRVLAVLGLPALGRIGNPDVARILPEVASAWVRWTAIERGLTGDAAERLDRAAREACGRLRAAGTGGQPTT